MPVWRSIGVLHWLGAGRWQLGAEAVMVKKKKKKKNLKRFDLSDKVRERLKGGEAGRWKMYYIGHRPMSYKCGA